MVMERALLILMMFLYGGSVLSQEEPSTQVAVYDTPPEGGWSEMERKGAACKALVWSVHRTSMGDLEFLARMIVRAKTKGATPLEQRALEAIGIDVSKILAMEGPEFGLWRAVADPSSPMPTPTHRFSDDWEAGKPSFMLEWIPISKSTY